ncbi:hypothetical protein M0657_010223 [Pyricularia oryzae]|nr:hypothetical protein OOU_Y34scaffold00165g10 [Pyricularia oryzae Y34]KAI7912025.1 hypothetical protein M9X92_010240 [Pyricularia oryzae]KAI7912968.1 hypothetical protein M0657_010223 [Pyricularia oryzae]
MNASHNDMLLFGDWVKYQHYLQTIDPKVPQILSLGETSLAAELGKNFDFADVFRQRLGLGRDFYIGVRQNIMAILQVWDAIVDERDMFEKLGSFTLDPNIQKAFIFCADTIPARVNIGSLGPKECQGRTLTLEPPKLRSYTADLGSDYASDLSFNSNTALEQVQSATTYPEALALSESEIVDEESEDNDEDEYTDDSDNENDEDYQDDEGEDCQDDDEKDTVPPADPQAQGTTGKKGTTSKKGQKCTLEELVQLDMAWALDPEGFRDMRPSEPAKDESHPAPKLSGKRGFVEISGKGEAGNKYKPKRQRK